MPSRLHPTRDEIHAAIGCLQRLSDVFEERRAQLAAGVGLTSQQWHVLEEISTEHFMPSMFARSRESSPAAVSKILRQLSDKRLISVSVSKEDARQRNYVLTNRGEDVMKQIRKSREDAIQRVWLPLPTGDVQFFAAFGARLVERLEGYAQENHSQLGRPRAEPRASTSSENKSHAEPPKNQKTRAKVQKASLQRAQEV